MAKNDMESFVDLHRAARPMSNVCRPPRIHHLCLP